MGALRLFLIMLVSLMTLALVAGPASAVHNGESHEFGNENFFATWARTDKPVADREVERTWMWGPEPYSPRLTEEYAQGPGGIREVQYFDKSRMEIIDPSADPNSLWYVTNGLLVVEMINGWYQIGADQFDESPEPANIPIAGDPESGSPTYADLNTFNLQDIAARERGTVIDEQLTDAGIEESSEFAEYNVTAAEFVPETNHAVASVFWEFMNRTGLIYDVSQQQFETGELFQNPFYATGYPITEAYWTRALLQGTPTDILWQCFERRCLTYTPSNPDQWKVEAGNVGQHYYKWRYPFGVPTEEVNVYLVDIGNERGVDNTFGCGDSLFALPVPIVTYDTTEAQIVAALETLFAIDERNFTSEEWYNTLYQSDLQVDSIAIENGTATIHLVGDLTIGGACDNPRVEEQLEQTVLQFDGVNDVVFYLNDDTEPLLPIEGA